MCITRQVCGVLLLRPVDMYVTRQVCGVLLLRPVDMFVTRQVCGVLLLRPVDMYVTKQEVECIAVDGQFVVSCCYGGQLRVWDTNTGECLSTMQRHR